MPVLRPAVLALCAVALAVPGLGRADEPKVKVKDKRDEYSYEYEDEHCKFKYKLKHEDGEEEVEREGDCPPARALPRFAPPVPYRSAEGPGARRTAGFCDSALAAAIGSQGAPDDGGAAAMVLGEMIGAVLGVEVGRRIGEPDRRCLGRTLEHVGPGSRVGWTSPESDLRYELRDFGPVRERHGVPCRRFEMRLADGTWREAEACRRGDGAWQLVELR